MAAAPRDSVLASGFVELAPDNLDELPDGPAWFRLRSPGQRVVYVGHGAHLRSAVRAVVAGQPVAGFATVEYQPCDDEAAARAAAEADIDELKPLYNDGFGRYRNSDTQIPKKGHRVRPAMHNP